MLSRMLRLVECSLFPENLKSCSCEGPQQVKSTLITRPHYGQVDCHQSPHLTALLFLLAGFMLQNISSVDYCQDCVPGQALGELESLEYDC